MKKKVSIYDAKAKLTSLVREVHETGESVVVTKHGKPVVDLVPHQTRKSSLKPHPALQGAEYKGHPCAPLPNKDWPEALRYNDPFDRMILATGVLHGLTIVSKDRQMARYGEAETVWG